MTAWIVDRINSSCNTIIERYQPDKFICHKFAEQRDFIFKLSRRSPVEHIFNTTISSFVRLNDTIRNNGFNLKIIFKYLYTSRQIPDLEKFSSGVCSSSRIGFKTSVLLEKSRFQTYATKNS
jgi:hypothetical protein